MRQHNHVRPVHFKPLDWLVAGVFIAGCAWLTHSLTANHNTAQQWSWRTLKNYFPNTLEENDAVPTPAMSEVSDTFSFKSLNIQTVSPISSASAMVSPLVAEETIERVIKHNIRRGDSLDLIFKKHELDRSLPFLISKHPIANALSKISIGKTIEFSLNEDDELQQIIYPVSALEQLIVKVADGKVASAAQIPLAYEIERIEKSGLITTSLYDAALEQGISISHIMDMVRIFGWDIDFVLDIRSGDSFHMIYEDFIFDGEKLADGALLAAQFTTQGNTYRAIRFDNGDDEVSYFAPTGESMLGTFLRSPVEFSRISSRFGKRKHPILKTWRAHRGVDYAAPRGTPIRATADGKVVHAGKKGGYGNTVILNHADRFSTLYAHMTGFAKNVKRGSRVKQGDVIGYIGSTGLATGPHLHYEFRLDGVHRNPLTFKTPKATAVQADLRAEFDILAAKYTQRLSDLAGLATKAKGDSTSELGAF
ncbi:MAG: M23 family metallopeptidase [Pseudomonadota bacterium]